MALVKKVSLCVFEKEPYDFTSKTTGERYQGYQYKGFDKEDNVVSFSSQRADIQDRDLDGYTDGEAQDFELTGSEWNGKVKWRLL